MLKRWSSTMLMSVCGALMMTTMLVGQEPVVEENHIPVGQRAESSEVRAADEQARAEKAKVASKAMTSAKSMGAKSASVHYTTHPGAYHNAYSISIYGAISLEDGSLWVVPPSDVYITLSWLPSDLLVITPNHSWFSAYNFKITNQNTGEAVLANLNLGPLYNGLYTRWIVAIDYYYNSVYLNDGSVWNMSSFDSDVVSKWLVNDTMIIGVNDGFFSYSNPNILINVNMLNYGAGYANY